MKISVSEVLNIALVSLFVMVLFFSVATSDSGMDRYDPWVDLNADGSINIMDVSVIARAFGANGDPAKTVTTSLATYENVTGGWLQPDEWIYLGYNISGFRRVSFSLGALPTKAGNLTFEVMILKLGDPPLYGTDGVFYYSGLITRWFGGPKIDDMFYYDTLDVVGPYLWITIYNPSPVERGYSLAVYMTA